MSVEETAARTIGIGHNRAPLKDLLTDNYADIAARADELVAATTRAPVSIDNDDTQGKVGDLIKMIGACVKRSEVARVSEKEPFLQAGREVDAFFKGISDTLEKTKRALESRVTTYLRAKADAERRRREEEEVRAREEADRLAAQAATAKQLDAAIEAETVAREATKAAEARPAEMARTRGDLGSVSTLRTVWDFEVIDYAGIPLDAIRPYIARSDLDKAIRGAVRSGLRDLKGVRIFENSTAVVR